MKGIASQFTPCDARGSTERSEVEARASHSSLAAAPSPDPLLPTVRLDQLAALGLVLGRDASGNSNLLNPWMYPSSSLTWGHRTGYTGDLTERSASRPLD